MVLKPLVRRRAVFNVSPTSMQCRVDFCSHWLAQNWAQGTMPFSQIIDQGFPSKSRSTPSPLNPSYISQSHYHYSDVFLVIITLGFTGLQGSRIREARPVRAAAREGLTLHDGSKGHRCHHPDGVLLGPGEQSRTFYTKYRYFTSCCDAWLTCDTPKTKSTLSPSPLCFPGEGGEECARCGSCGSQYHPDSGWKLALF